MVTTYPSLSGWDKEPYSIMDNVLACFFVSEYSQSTYYRGNVASLPWLVQQHGTKSYDLSKAIEETVRKLLVAWFGNGTVITSVTDSTDRDDARYEIRINATVEIDGKSYSMGKLVNINNSTVNKIINLNNG